MIELQRLNSVSVMTSNVGSTHMTPREDHVRLSDALTYGDQRAAEAREQMREECVKELQGMTTNNATARSAIKQCAEALKELK